jgi:hypothetical protein
LTDPAWERSVVKAPDASSLLSRLASAVARLGMTGPQEQLYQVATNPLHLFTVDWLARFLDHSGEAGVKNSPPTRFWWFLALLAVAGAATRVVLILSRKNGPREPGEIPSVLRLPVPGIAPHRLAGETRSAAVLEGGKTLGWRLEKGPPRRFRVDYFFHAPEGSRGELRLTMDRGTGVRRVELSEAISPNVAQGSGWRSWDAALPALNRRSSLSLSFFSQSPDGSSPAVLLGQPSVSEDRLRSPRLVVLFMVDTLRQDRVSAYGYRLPTTPNIDRFFSDGLVWENCYANSPWTLASHATIFTSTLPERHGVGELVQRLPDDLPLLAEVLSGAGWRTLAVTNGGYIDPIFGFSRGFDDYYVGLESTEARVRQALGLIDQYRGERIFLFFHTYQVHEYSPKAQSAQQLFGSVGSLGPSWTTDVRDVLVHHRFARKLPEWLNHRYDAAVRSVDDGFGDLMAGLRERNLLASAAVWLTSDHGEEIFDRQSSSESAGSIGHLHPLLYDEYLRVPLFAKIPWGTMPKGRIRKYVSLMDLAPSILESLGTASPQTFQGRSLLSPSVSSEEELIVSKAPRFDAVAVRRGERKIIVRSGFPLVSWEDGTVFELPSRECFDTGKDPGERSRLGCDAPWAGQLMEEADRITSDTFPGSVVVHLAGTRSSGGVRVVELRVRGREEAPEAFSFGTDPSHPCWTRGNAAECRFRIARAPAWIAFHPRRIGAALDAQLFGFDKDEFRQGDFTWSQIYWRRDSPFPAGSSIFTTGPGEPMARPANPPLSPEVLERLRSLGYLSSGTSSTSAVLPALRALEPFHLADGLVRIRVFAGSPERTWPQRPAAVRAIHGLSPSETQTGVGFQVQQDGSSALGVTGEGFLRSDTLLWNGQPLPTVYGDSTFISASVPAVLLARPGSVTVTIQDFKEASVPVLRAIFKILPPATPKE